MSPWNLGPACGDEETGVCAAPPDVQERLAGWMRAAPGRLAYRLVPPLEALEGSLGLGGEPEHEGDSDSEHETPPVGDRAPRPPSVTLDDTESTPALGSLDYATVFTRFVDLAELSLPAAGPGSAADLAPILWACRPSLGGLLLARHFAGEEEGSRE